MGVKRQGLRGLAVVVVLLGLCAAGPALAAGDPQAVVVAFTGTVTAVDAGAGTWQVEVRVQANRTVAYTVHVPAGAGPADVAAGDVVEVEGVLTGPGLVNATRVEVERGERPGQEPAAAKTAGPKVKRTVMPLPRTGTPPTPSVTPVSPTRVVTGTVTPGDGPFGDKGGRFCRDGTAVHPVAQGIAETYGVTYQEVMAWFCQGKAGFGQIILALQTAEVAGETADAYLARRAGGEGWGNIWQGLGLTGKGKKSARPGLTAQPTVTGTGTPASGSALGAGTRGDKGGRGEGKGKPQGGEKVKKPGQAEDRDGEKDADRAQGSGRPASPGEGRGSGRR